MLAVCLPAAPGQTPGGLAFHAAATGEQAIAMLRVLRFDFLLVGTTLPDASLWDWLGRIRLGWPWQKWCLVAGELPEDDETRARVMGVCKIFGTVPEGSQLRAVAESLRRGARDTFIRRAWDRIGHPRLDRETPGLSG